AGTELVQNDTGREPPEHEVRESLERGQAVDGLHPDLGRRDHHGRREIEDAEYAGVDHGVGCRLGGRDGNGEEDHVEAELGRRSRQVVEMPHLDATDAATDLLVIDVEGGYQLEVVLAKLREIGQRLAQATHADDGYLPRPSEAQDAAQFEAQAMHGVAAPTRSEAAEVSEILTYLERGHLSLGREMLGGGPG